MDYKKINSIDNVVWFVETIIKEAISLKSSDIHIEPQKDFLNIRFRIDWDMHKKYEVSNEYKDNLISRIKILWSLKIDENRLPQDWKLQYRQDWTNEDIDVRISTFPISNWEKVCLRILKKDTWLLNIDWMWFLDSNLSLIKESLKLKEWLILVSWPTWSGKTTTLYAMLNNFNPEDYNISTLEDPIEYTFPWINQSQIRHEIWYNFPMWLKTLLRQDPDIVLVWEIRDKETAELAIEASLTWHLVLWTIHANTWIWVVERLTNMWIDKYLVASALKLVISQRLVKKLCSCSVETKFSEKEISIFERDIPLIWKKLVNSQSPKKAIWCDKCIDTWYKWRMWIHEVISIDDELSELIISPNLSKSNWDNVCEKKWYIDLYTDWLVKSIFWFTNLEHVLVYK